MTRPSETGAAMSPEVGVAAVSALPHTRATRASAITWPRLRSSPTARAESAARVSAASAATPSLTGSRAVR